MESGERAQLRQRLTKEFCYGGRTGQKSRYRRDCHCSRTVAHSVHLSSLHAGHRCLVLEAGVQSDDPPF